MVTCLVSVPGAIRAACRATLRGKFMRNSKWAVVAVAAVTVSLLSGCDATTTNDGGPAEAEAAGYEPSFEPATCPTPIAPGYPAADLGPEFECGYLTVPENRDDPGGASVRIAVARIPAVSSTPEQVPMVYLNGGPGNSSLQIATGQVAAGMNTDREVIFVDQRGTFHSEPSLACPEIDAFLAEAVTLPFPDPATTTQSNAATTACRDRLVAEGIDLAAYNSVENSHDIADLRVALGIEEWDVYGVSYGTDLALTVMRDHPEGVRAVVLDSVVPPNLNVISEFWPTAADGYRALFDTCAAQPACAAAYPELEREFTDTVDRLSDTPLTVAIPDASGGTVEVVIDGYQLANITLLLLASGPERWSHAPDMIHRLAQGDGVSAATLIKNYVPPAGWIGLGLQWGVFCGEFGVIADPDEVLAHARTVLPGFPDETLAFLPQVPWFFDDCAIWDVGDAGAAARAPVESDIPTLIMAGTFDAVTAPTWGEALTGLSDSQTVAFPGLGHHVFNQSPCAAEVMNNFLTDPDAAVDDSCVEGMTLPTIVTP